jgi:hypothetical protein
MKEQIDILHQILESGYRTSPLFLFEEDKLEWSNQAAKSYYPHPDDTPHVVISLAAQARRELKELMWKQPSSGRTWRIRATPLHTHAGFRVEARDAVYVVMETPEPPPDDFPAKVKTWSEMAAAWKVSHALDEEQNPAWQKFWEMVSRPAPALVPMLFADQLEHLKKFLLALPSGASLGPRLEWKASGPINDVWVESNPESLALALDEIIRNAIETRVGTVLLQAGVTVEGTRCELRILHRHHGEKEAPHWPERGGEPFVTTKAGHIGLGLARARLVVFQQRGELRWVVSPYGTLTTLSFPCVSEATKEKR